MNVFPICQYFKIYFQLFFPLINELTSKIKCQMGIFCMFLFCNGNFHYLRFILVDFCVTFKIEDQQYKELVIYLFMLRMIILDNSLFLFLNYILVVSFSKNVFLIFALFVLRITPR